MFRWLLTIGLSIATVVSVYFFYQQRLGFKEQGLKIDIAKTEIHQLNTATQTLENQKKHAQLWKRLSEKVRASNFDPDRWELYPVSINSRLSWNRFEELMLSISNANTQEAGYWFLPKSLGTDSPSTSSKTFVQNVLDTDQASPSEPSIQVRLEGAFLIHQ